MNIPYCEDDKTLVVVDSQLLCHARGVSEPVQYVSGVDVLTPEVFQFQPEVFSVALGGMLALWVVGLGVGLVVQQIRMLRKP